MNDLDKLRKQIDALDEELLKTLAQRMEVIEAIGKYKKANGLELRDEERFQALLSAQLSRAEALNLPKELVTELCELIHTFALEREAGA
jgi:chorismate mutase